MDKELENMRNLKKMYPEMVEDILRLRFIIFSMMRLPRIGYQADNKTNKRVDLATACSTYY